MVALTAVVLCAVLAPSTATPPDRVQTVERWQLLSSRVDDLSKTMETFLDKVSSSASGEQWRSALLLVSHSATENLDQGTVLTKTRDELDRFRMRLGRMPQELWPNKPLDDHTLNDLNDEMTDIETGLEPIQKLADLAKNVLPFMQ
jgi:hypothetical protein